jgi:hypothetical protein
MLSLDSSVDVLYIYISMHVCIHIDIYIYTYIYILTYTYTYPCMYVYIYTHMAFGLECWYVYIHVYMYVCMHVYIYTYIHMAFGLKCWYVYIHVCMYVYIYIYTYGFRAQVFICIHLKYISYTLYNVYMQEISVNGVPVSVVVTTKTIGLSHHVCPIMSVPSCLSYHEPSYLRQGYLYMFINPYWRRYIYIYIYIYMLWTVAKKKRCPTYSCYDSMSSMDFHFEEEE